MIHGDASVSAQVRKQKIIELKTSSILNEPLAV